MHSTVSKRRGIPSFPALNSGLFKALLEPSLLPGWGQRACTGFWAQKDTQVEASGDVCTTCLLPANPAAGFPAPAPAEADGGLLVALLLSLCKPTGHGVCNTGKQYKNAQTCTTLSFFTQTWKEKANSPPGYK